MRHRHRDHDESRILDLGDHSVVADAVAPVAREVAAETFAARPRVIEGAQLFEIGDDAALNGPIELDDRLVEGRRRLDVPLAQSFNSLLRSLSGRDVLPLAS